ncbi:MAG: penicillin-binding protein activator LpoB [Phycisphaerales bacterium]|nr:penicillin-binding protein activator LpoB [Phycisphaerales bacterium]MCB9835677.1 penicillin-binding protein activator LpoB [Phycisphaera sp.]
MRYTTHIIAASAAALVLTTGACSPNWKVKRIDPEKTVDLDYRFDDEDARQVARGMIEDALAKPWINEFMAVNEKRPLVVVGNVKNETEDYINPDLFTDVIQEELLNSGKVRFIAERDLRAELRQERIEDLEFRDPATIKNAAMEKGADYMMLGRIKDVKERSVDQRKVVNFYQVTLELIDIETNEKVWIESREIKKTASR